MQNNRARLFSPFPIRILAGIAFIAHGYPKMVNVAGTEGFFVQVGLPAALATPIALLEFIGGIALILGILTRIASGLFIAEMALATLLVKFPKGFVGGFELDLLLLAGAVSLLISGPGRISIEWDVIKREIIPVGKRLVMGR